MFIRRDLALIIDTYRKYPVIALLGPRQSGKTTLVQHLFTSHHFVTLEDPETRQLAAQDPRGFFRTYENEHGIILDEFQYVPELLSYIQIIADQKQRPGYFILTGSQNFLMNEAVTQSLAGRVGILTLLPLSLHELAGIDCAQSADEAMVLGGYPRLHVQSFLSTEFYPSYIHTYLERDVRMLDHVGDLLTFQKFMSLCAGRTAQLLNISDIATNCGVDRRTITKWISMLEASYIIFLLPPYFENFNKRVTKIPKLYFFDTGLAAALLEIKSAKELSTSSLRGPLFENLIIADLYKQYANVGLRPPLYYWRDQNGRLEVDCIIKQGATLIPIEIKSSQTIVNEFFDGIQQWNVLTKSSPEKSYLVYAGDENQARTKAHVTSWRQAGTLVRRIESD